MRTRISTRCHCVGVSLISAPAGVVARLVARSMRKSGVSIDGKHLVAGLGPPQRGAQAREELTHAERLRDVVVGAGVERHDLLRILVPGREHDDRDRGPAPEAVHDFDAVDAGQAEVDDRRVVRARRAARQRGLARLDEIDLVAARFQMRTERTQQRTLVVNDQDATHDAHSSCSAARSCNRETDDHRDATARCVLNRQLAADCVDEPPRDREPEPDAGVARRVAEALERLEHSLSLRERDPATSVDDPQIDAIGHGRRFDREPDRSVPSDAPRCRRRSRPARSSSAGSTSTSGRRLGYVDARRSPPALRLAIAAGTISSSPAGRLTSSSAPDCKRLMSSRFSTSLLSRSASVSMLSA